jgi:hypothetical protein
MSGYKGPYGPDHEAAGHEAQGMQQDATIRDLRAEVERLMAKIVTEAEYTAGVQFALEAAEKRATEETLEKAADCIVWVRLAKDHERRLTLAADKLEAAEKRADNLQAVWEEACTQRDETGLRCEAVIARLALAEKCVDACRYVLEGVPWKGNGARGSLGGARDLCIHSLAALDAAKKS